MVKTFDCSVHGSMGFYTFIMNTDEARDWVEENVQRESYNSGPMTFSVDNTSMALDISNGMFEAGLTVEVNGAEYQGQG